jgi:hypothetical protein
VRGEGVIRANVLLSYTQEGLAVSLSSYLSFKCWCTVISHDPIPLYLDELKIYKAICQKLVKAYRCKTLSNHVMSIYCLKLDRNNEIKNKALSEGIVRLEVSSNSLLF